MPVIIKKSPQKTVHAASLASSRLFNPMLAAEGVLGQIDYGTDGLIALPKHNGVRGCIQQGSLVARSLKPIPNHHTRALFCGHHLSRLEGELVVGDPFDEEVFSISTSGVMTQEGTPDVVWYIFDQYHPTNPFVQRINDANDLVSKLDNPRIQAIPYHWVSSDEELVALSDKYLALGFEGLVLRAPKARYKTGRSTAKEQGFLRYCPWLRDEGLIIKIHEGTINNNESKRNERGYLEKSSHKENMVGSGRAGAVTVLWKDGIEFNMLVPSVALQDEVWKYPERFLGKMVKFKFKPAVIRGGKPRFPCWESVSWEGLRHPDDMS